MHEFESDTDRAERLYRTLDSLIKRVNAGEKPGPLREHLQMALMISPLAGSAHAAMTEQLDAAIRRAGEAGPAAPDA